MIYPGLRQVFSKGIIHTPCVNYCIILHVNGEKMSNLIANRILYRFIPFSTDTPIPLYYKLIIFNDPTQRASKVLHICTGDIVLRPIFLQLTSYNNSSTDTGHFSEYFSRRRWGPPALGHEQSSSPGNKRC